MKRPLGVLAALLLRPQPTGVGQAIRELTRALAARPLPFDVVVLCTSPELLAPLAQRDGGRLLPCPAAAGGTLRKAAWTQLVMPRLLGDLGADLLHCLQFVAPLRAPCPLVVTVHDLGYLRYPATIEEPRRTYYRWLVPRSLRRAQAVVCNSRATAAEVSARFPELAGRVEVTPFGTPTWVEDRPAPAPVGERPQDAPFLFVGTLEPRKNLEGLLTAYGAFVADREGTGRPCPRLVLVGGRGWQDSRIRSRLAPLAASGQVVVKDYCGPVELWQEYSLARALLFPSLHEGFGFPILEAMAAGLPVLTSDRGAMAEVAGDAALLVNPDDQAALVAGMNRLADDTGFCRDLAARGRSNCARWTWAETARTTSDVYRRLLAARR